MSLIKNSTFRFILLLLILLCCWLLGRSFSVNIKEYQEFLAHFPKVISGVVFVVLYVGITSLVWFGPKDILRILAAVFFGPAVSTLFVWLGELVNSVILFHVSRSLGREFVIQKFRLKERHLDHVDKDSSLLWIVALRINPLVPFRLLDLGFGLTGIDFRKYYSVVVIVSPLRIFWLQYILAAVGSAFFSDITVAQKYFLENPAALVYSVVYLLFVIVLTVLAIIFKARKKAHVGSTDVTNKKKLIIIIGLIIAGLMAFLYFQMKKDRFWQEKVRANQMARDGNLNQATKEYVESIRRRNRERLSRITPGMDQAQALKIMGESHIALGSPQRDFRIDSPWRVESIKGKNGGEFTVAYFYTEFIHADGQVNDDELTPLIFKDDKVAGWGWDIFHDLIAR